MNKDLDGFFKKKGFIEECTGKKAIVQLIDSGKRAKIHQKELETVIPQPGRPVIVMKGELAKKTGILKEIKQKEFCVIVEVQLTDTETTEAIFKFDEISKKYEKKKKKVDSVPITTPAAIESPSVTSNPGSSQIQKENNAHKSSISA